MTSKLNKTGKARSVLSQTFIDSCAELTEEQVADMVVKAEQRIKEIKHEQECDEKLSAAKSIIKDLNSGYSSVIKHERARIDFLLGKLEESEEDEE